MEATNELAAALAAAQAEMPIVGKSGTNTFDKYTYAKLEDYVKVIRPIFAKHGLAMLTSVDAVESLPIRKTQLGKDEYPVRVRLTLTIMHKSGGSLSLTAFGEGQDRGDKAVYKATTGGRKYLLASALGLATGDDPENDEPRNPAPAARPVAAKPASDVRSEVMAMIRDWSGIKADSKDFQSAIVSVAKKAGLAIPPKGQQAPESFWAGMREFVLSNSERDFAEAVA